MGYPNDGWFIKENLDVPPFQETSKYGYSDRHVVRTWFGTGEDYNRLENQFDVLTSCLELYVHVHIYVYVYDDGDDEDNQMIMRMISMINTNTSYIYMYITLYYIMVKREILIPE